MLGTVTIYRPETQTNKLKLTLRNSSLLICHVCLSLPLKWEKWQNSDKNCKIVTLTSFMRLCYCFPFTLRGCLHEKTCTGASLITGWLFDFTWWLGHFMLMKYMCDSKSPTLRMHYPFQSTGRPISHWNGLLFCVYMTPLWVFVLEWNSCPGTRAGVSSCRGDLRRHNILWWYHVNKYRAMRGNRSELALGWRSPRCHVNTPLNTISRPSKKVNPRSCFGPRILDLW